MRWGTMRPDFVLRRSNAAYSAAPLAYRGYWKGSASRTVVLRCGDVASGGSLGPGGHRAGVHCRGNEGETRRLNKLKDAPKNEAKRYKLPLAAVEIIPRAGAVHGHLTIAAAAE